MNPIAQIDTLYLAGKFRELSEQLNHISEYTNDFNDTFSTIFTISSLIASLVTIGGITAIFFKIYKSSISTKKQKKIIIDLLRHLMVNNAILEYILDNMKNKGIVPVEGTLARFATLEDDMDLGKFSERSSNYEMLHNISLHIRNYNSIASYADTHMHQTRYPGPLLEKELNDIFKRSKKISDELLELSKKIHNSPVTKKSFAEYAKEKYNEKAPVSSRIMYGYYKDFGLAGIYEFLIDEKSKNLLY